VGRKNSAGILQGAWSTPSRVSGENGRDGEGAIYPRYRVVTNIADTGNTGMITPSTGGAAIAMNDLDWVLYMGATADWTKARLYQWHKTDSVWTMLDPAQNMSRYMDVLETITENAADGIFSTVFCKILFAQQAAIDTLASKVLRMSGNGEIVSDNYDDGSQDGHSRTGFKMTASNGAAVFNKIDTFEMRGYSKLGPSMGGTDYYPKVTGRVYGYIRGHLSGTINANGTITNLRKTDNIDTVATSASLPKNYLLVTLKDDGWSDVNIYTKMRVFGYAVGATYSGSTLYDNYQFVPYLAEYNSGTKEMQIKLIGGHISDSYTITQSLYFNITLYC
jgi:hypothetical protein